MSRLARKLLREMIEADPAAGFLEAYRKGMGDQQRLNSDAEDLVRDDVDSRRGQRTQAGAEQVEPIYGGGKAEEMDFNKIDPGEDGNEIIDDNGDDVDEGEQPEGELEAEDEEARPMRAKFKCSQCAEEGVLPHGLDEAEEGEVTKPVSAKCSQGHDNSVAPPKGFKFSATRTNEALHTFRAAYKREADRGSALP